MHITETIVRVMKEVAEAVDSELKKDLSDDLKLFDSGLDSLGFAVLVARLEEELGYDPFVLMEDPVYPTTMGEFVEIYQRFGR